MRYVGGEVDGLNPQEVAEEEERAGKDWGNRGAGFEAESSWFEDGRG